MDARDNPPIEIVEATMPALSWNIALQLYVLSDETARIYFAADAIITTLQLIEQIQLILPPQLVSIIINSFCRFLCCFLKYDLSLQTFFLLIINSENCLKPKSMTRKKQAAQH